MGLFEFLGGAVFGVVLAFGVGMAVLVGARLKKVQFAFSRQRVTAAHRVPSRRC